MKIKVAAAVNEPETLAHCLARSPDIVAGALALHTFQDYPTAGAAYNAAIDNLTDADVIVFAHQDVYLPKGWSARLTEQLAGLDKIDPNWAIAGVIGGNAAREIIGQTWCSGHQKLLGARVGSPMQVVTLDEMVLILRVSAQLRFDQRLPSFHLYGADIILSANETHRTTWVIDLPTVHHSKPVISLGGAYARSYRYIQRKWRPNLPIFNLVCPLERGMWRYWLTEARLRWKHRRLRARPIAVGDPVEIARQIGYET